MQYQRLRQQAMMQQSLYPHPGLLAAPQIEPILSGNLPPGFDSSACRSVYVGNIHPQVTEPLLQEVFSSIGPIEGCKLIRKEKSSYGFVDYFDRRSAAVAIISLNGRNLFGQPIKVNWAYASSQREDTSGHFNIFVGDLSPEVTDATLFACFSVYPSCSDARVMWDQKTGRSRGYGFVAFRNEQDAQSAINDINGKWLGSRQIRCNWATKGASSGDDKQSSDSRSVVELTTGTSEGGQEKSNEEAPENNPQYTTVYVGNLAPEVTSVDLHRYFHTLGAGTIEDVRVQRDKGFGFVRYGTHAEAALAIQMGNARVVCGKPIKCSWGSKPTPPGTNSAPLPPPNVGHMPGLSAADLAAYERQMALSKMGAARALMHPQAAQHALKQAAMGMGIGIGIGGAGTSQTLYDIVLWNQRKCYVLGIVMQVLYSLVVGGLQIWIAVKGQHRLKLTITSHPGDVEIFWNINDICVATYTNKVGLAVFTFKLG
ncbi:Oligouridylate-binding protein 1, partial [Cucurbita argyrosperma subsp. sororia]